MKEKTKERLEKEFLALPLHHIDTSILLEVENTENGRFCQRYLQKIGSKYRGSISLPVIGEVLLNILSLKTIHEKYVLLEIADSLISIRKIKFYIPLDISETLTKIKSLDSRIEPTDAMIFACAVEDNVNTLVTLDKNLIHNEKLEKEFGIKIKHPRELL